MSACISRQNSILCFVFAVAFVLVPRATQAQGQYPEHIDDYVNDFAEILSEQDSSTIHKLFEDLEHQTGIEAVVVTIKSIADYDTEDVSIEKFATNLFNTWGIGHKKENNGVLILVASGDRKCRIELGGGYGDRYNDVMKQIIDDEMIPYFKTDEYSRGIHAGAIAVVGKVT